MDGRESRTYTRQAGSRPPGRPPRPAIDRFTDQYAIDEATGCWLWTSAKDRDGYGTFFEGRGLEQRAHRFAYKHFVRPVPKGLVLDHLCSVKHCVNPEHLEAVTNRENILRGRRPLGERTHCKHGHEFTPENTYIPTNGIGRVCRRRRQAA